MCFGDGPEFLDLSNGRLDSLNGRCPERIRMPAKAMSRQQDVNAIISEPLAPQMSRLGEIFPTGRDR